MMKLNAREHTFDTEIFRQVYWENEYELGDLRGETVLDIGAHIGSFAIKAAQCGARAVYSLEPNLENFALASLNTADIEACNVRNIAVSRSDKKETMFLDMSDNPSNHGGSCTVTDFGEEVETTSLDSLIDELKPSFIKIDAEGAEYPVLYTCTKLDQVETIIGEFHNALGTHNMGLFSLDEKTPKFLADFKGRLNICLLIEFLKEQGFRVLVDNVNGNIGHFWASRTFQGLQVEPEPSSEEPLFPGKTCVHIDLSSGKWKGRDAVFCISIEEHGERLKNFQRRAQEVRQEYAIWLGYDARNQSREEVEAGLDREITWDMPDNPGALTRPAEAGLLWSSVTLWQHAYDNGLEYVAIMEDDAFLKKALKFSVPIDADIVFFNDRSFRRENGVVTGAICGTDGYLLSRSGMRKMLEIYKTFWMPVDLQWQPQIEGLRECGHILSSYSSDALPSVVGYALPPFVGHGSSASTIR